MPTGVLNLFTATQKIPTEYQYTHRLNRLIQATGLKTIILALIFHLSTPRIPFPKTIIYSLVTTHQTAWTPGPGARSQKEMLSAFLLLYIGRHYLHDLAGVIGNHQSTKYPYPARPYINSHNICYMHLSNAPNMPY